jgi:ABC-2 type transport system permease protein
MISYAVQGSALSTAFQTDIVFSTQHKIEIGDLIIDLLRPVRWQFMVFAEYLGLSLAQLAAIAAPVLVLSLLAFGMAGPVSTEAAVLSAISMVLGVTIDFGIVYLTLLLAFRFTHINGFEFAIRGLRPLITGAFVPLWIFPDAVGDVLAFSPSPYIFYAPLSIYVGRVSDTEIFATLGAQAVWVAVMTGSGAYFTSRSMRKLVVQGG